MQRHVAETGGRDRWQRQVAATGAETGGSERCRDRLRDAAETDSETSTEQHLLILDKRRAVHLHPKRVALARGMLLA